MGKYRVKKCGYYYSAEKKWLCFWIGLPHGLCAGYADANRVCLEHARMCKEDGLVYDVDISGRRYTAVCELSCSSIWSACKRLLEGRRKK